MYLLWPVCVGCEVLSPQKAKFEVQIAELKQTCKDEEEEVVSGWDKGRSLVIPLIYCLPD